MPSDSIIKAPLETNKYLLIYSIPILFTTSFIPELIQAFVVGDFGKKDLYRACVCIKPLIIRKKKIQWWKPPLPAGTTDLLQFMCFSGLSNLAIQ